MFHQSRYCFLKSNFAYSKKKDLDNYPVGKAHNKQTNTIATQSGKQVETLKK